MKPLFRTKLFTDLFPEVINYTSDDRNRTFLAGDLVVSGYCSRTHCLRMRLKSLFVVPAPKVLQKLQQVMLKIDGDVIYFAVTHHKDGTASVMASYNKILGTKLLAIVNGGSVRKTPKTRKARR